jgi:hypothetical protein
MPVVTKLSNDSNHMPIIGDRQAATASPNMQSNQLSHSTSSDVLLMTRFSNLREEEEEEDEDQEEAASAVNEDNGERQRREDIVIRETTVAEFDRSASAVRNHTLRFPSALELRTYYRQSIMHVSGDRRTSSRAEIDVPIATGIETESTHSDDSEDSDDSDDSDDDHRLPYLTGNRYQHHIRGRLHEIGCDLSTDELLNKLYNYMKISEMDKYGISVFETVVAQYLRHLDETDFQTLVTSYWCNEAHFQCLIRYRGTEIAHRRLLQLQITDSLMDHAMQGGASVGKIQSMLRQRRIDTRCLRLSLKHERDFFMRNCRLRFWNHEVLVRAYIQNNWLTPALAQIGINKFAAHVYDNTMKSASTHASGFSDHFLHSFFMSHFSLDSIPKMYAEMRKSRADTQTHQPHTIAFSDENCLEKTFSERTLRRWCELLELLTSRGAKISRTRFKLLPLAFAVELGINTWWIINSSIHEKNELLMDSIGVALPMDLWALIVHLL